MCVKSSVSLLIKSRWRQAFFEKLGRISYRMNTPYRCTRWGSAGWPPTHEGGVSHRHWTTADRRWRHPAARCREWERDGERSRTAPAARRKSVVIRHARCNVSSSLKVTWSARDTGDQGNTLRNTCTAPVLREKIVRARARSRLCASSIYVAIVLAKESRSSWVVRSLRRWNISPFSRQTRRSSELLATRDCCRFCWPGSFVITGRVSHCRCCNFSLAPALRDSRRPCSVTPETFESFHASLLQARWKGAIFDVANRRDLGRTREKEVLSWPRWPLSKIFAKWRTFR